MASLMDNFLSSGATAYPSSATAKKMLKEIPELSGVKVYSVRDTLTKGTRTPLKTKAKVSAR